MSEDSKSDELQHHLRCAEKLSKYARKPQSILEAMIMSKHKITNESIVNIDIDQLLSGPIHRMSHVFRFSSVPVIRKESVSEHSWYVAFYAFLIGQDLAQQGYEIDFGEMLSRALVHDLDESMTGDFLRYVKYGHPDLKKALDEVSVTMIDKMGAGLRSGGSAIKKHWSDAKADDIEGHIIQVADLSRVLSYVWEELKMGNTHVDNIMGECTKYIKEFIDQHPNSPVSSYAREIVDWVAEVWK